MGFGSGGCLGDFFEGFTPPIVFSMASWKFKCHLIYYNLGFHLGNFDIIAHANPLSQPYGQNILFSTEPFKISKLNKKS